MSPDELLALIERTATGVLEAGERELLASAVRTLVNIQAELAKKGASIKRLRKLIFGGRKTEKTRLVLSQQEPATGLEPAPTQTTPTAPSEEPVSAPASIQTPAPTAPPATPKPKPPGHGRLPASAYTGATHVHVTHPFLKPGDSCPCGCGGHLRPFSPHISVHFTGSPLLTATVERAEVLRSDRCNHLYAARAVRSENRPKFDARAKAQLAGAKYGFGMPFHRLAQMQQAAGVPLSAQTQWDVVHETARDVLPAFRELDRQAAQGERFHNDDTVMKVLELTPELRAEQAADEGISEERTGSFTTGIVSIHEGHELVVFKTGRQHAGENLDDLLAKREPGRPTPQQMCDALARNIPPSFKTILLNCLTHGRRKFVDIVEAFPEECRYVLETLRAVYANDDRARQERMSDQERLAFHQANSQKLMDDLRAWMETQLAGKKAEPNSALGEAILYMTKRWDRFTGFLREPGAPLDNNICERALKKVVLHRKNALFYKTLNGALVGDIFMSLIQTALRAKVSPFEYLTALITHRQRLREAPAEWMPWKFKETLQRLAAPSRLAT